VKLFENVCDVLMMLAISLQKRLYYAMKYMPGGHMYHMLQTVERVSEETA
jgi:hypothetical protein